MADQILSQEEIDALLGAMSKGEIDIQDEEAGQTEIKTYDLTSQSAMLRDQLHGLEEVYDKFTRLLRNSLANSLQRKFEVDLAATEMVKFGEFMKSFTNPTSFSIFSMEPLIGSALVAIEPDLVFSLIDCMFGGKGKTVFQNREFTLIEQRMIKRFTGDLLKDFQRAWAEIFPVKVPLKKFETKCEFVHLVVPDELVIGIVFSLTGEEFSGNIQFCIPYIMLEPIKERLCPSYLMEKDKEHTWGPEFEKLLRQIDVSVSAELGRTVQSVEELLGLEPENVLKLGTGPDDPVVVNIENVPKFKGVMGVMKGNRAVQITEMMSRSRGGDIHGRPGSE